MFRCGRTRAGVPLLVHWSVPAISLFLLGVEVRHIVHAAIGIGSYLAMLLIHEVGHQYVAQRRGCRVFSIEIYPIHGLCRHETPASPYDKALIAWGGVAAQLIVAIPILIGVNLFGYTPFDLLNIVLAILGFLSPAVALFNLLPIAPLDGKRHGRSCRSRGRDCAGGNATSLPSMHWKRRSKTPARVDVLPP